MLLGIGEIPCHVPTGCESSGSATGVLHCVARHEEIDIEGLCSILVSESSPTRNLARNDPALQRRPAGWPPWRRIGQPSVIEEVQGGAILGCGREGESECEKKAHLKMPPGIGCAPMAEVWCL